MTERKAWSKQQDAALTEIVQVRKIKKWNDVSSAMEIYFNVHGRTGKQCRERWHNQLDPTIKNTDWTKEEERILFCAHNQHGNKWATISKLLQGRTDNCIKNHFYSTLRKAFRRLNKFTSQNKQKAGLKQLKPIMLSKLVAAAEDKFDGKLKLAPEIIEMSVELKNRLVPFSKEVENTPDEEEEIEALIKDVLLFCKSYKRKKGKKCPKDDEESAHEQESCLSQSDHLKQEAPTLNASSLQASGKGTSPNLGSVWGLAMAPIDNIKSEFTNLFQFPQAQMMSQPQQPFQLNNSIQVVKQQYQPPQRTLNIEQQVFQSEMIRRQSGMSNWSFNFYRVPSLQDRISGMSNLFNLDLLGYDTYNGNINMFGVDFHVQ